MQNPLSYLSPAEQSFLQLYRTLSDEEKASVTQLLHQQVDDLIAEWEPADGEGE